MITSEKVDKVLPALFELKKQLKPMTKDSKNPFFKSSYLELPDLLDSLEPLLDGKGLLLTQANCHRHGDEYVVSRLSHAESGQYVEAEYKIGFVEDAQKQGAKSTYGRRFSLKGLIGLSEHDDDGNAATGKKSEEAKPAQRASGFNARPEASSTGDGVEAPVQAEDKTLTSQPARRGSFGTRS